MIIHKRLKRTTELVRQRSTSRRILKIGSLNKARIHWLDYHRLRNIGRPAITMTSVFIQFDGSLPVLPLADAAEDFSPENVINILWSETSRRAIGGSEVDLRFSVIPRAKKWGESREIKPSISQGAFSQLSDDY